MKQTVLTKTLSFGVNGVNGFPVTVEVYCNGGLPGLEIIGLPDASLKESKDRVRAAIESTGAILPFNRIVVNLAPADIKKEGSSFDLAIAIGCLSLMNDDLPNEMEDTVLIGGLSLDGSLQPVRGVLPMVISANQTGIRKVILPIENAPEVSCIQGMEIYPAENLRQVLDHLIGIQTLKPQPQQVYEEILRQAEPLVDMSQVKGQTAARRALEIAAAGGHNMLMIGAPGSGKTMLARCLPGILPPLNFDEALETTKIHSIAGKLDSGKGLMIKRPFCAPHHSASVASLIGGGSSARPGEVSLAHNGVLFLDELPEFSRSALESLRQPLEDGVVSVTRVLHQAQYQSSFMLIAGMNPCPCGYFGSTQKQCTCTPREIKRYLDKISGPLLDRIDIQIEMDAVAVQDINNAQPSESSSEVAARVEKARKIQQNRYKGTGIHCNAQLDSKQLVQYCTIDAASQQLLDLAVEKMGLSMRAYGRVLKVARTIADLKNNETITVDDISEAIQYRDLDQKYWG